MGEFSKVAQETLTAMPSVFKELQEEGMLYFAALEAISLELGGLSSNGGKPDRVTNACQIAAEALEGFERRILHRAPTGKLRALAEQVKR